MGKATQKAHAPWAQPRWRDAEWRDCGESALSKHFVREISKARVSFSGEATSIQGIKRAAEIRKKSVSSEVKRRVLIEHRTRVNVVN